jgi:nitronate monooxygenase
MGAGVSSWRLARAVSRRNHLGVVSGTALATILVRRLQEGDPGGHLARAASHFPLPQVVERAFQAYYIAGGKPQNQPYRLSPLPSQNPGRATIELTVLANFMEVFLAKEGHQGVVGINYLEKIQFPTLASIYGALMAGVDYVLMGAGIPRSIPGILDELSQGRHCRLKLDVEQAAPGEVFEYEFDPKTFMGEALTQLKRPRFLAIISSATLALTLARKSNGHVDGFIVEGASAGGHNAPPRGPLQLTGQGEPIYGPRDVPDLAKIREIGLPFWLAGSFADPEKIDEALRDGATGVQVGTPFAFCEESGIAPELKRRVIARAKGVGNQVFTDPVASPTGFPFKVLQLDETMSDAATYGKRTRICDLGYLRHGYRKADGTLGYRCPAEPVADYLAKGGLLADTVGRKCVCNGLMATIGMGQALSETEFELALITAGDDVSRLARFLPNGRSTYSADAVLDFLERKSNA